MESGSRPGSRILDVVLALWPFMCVVVAWEMCAFISGSRFVPHLPTIAQTVWRSFWMDAIIAAQGGGSHGYAPHVWATLQSFMVAMAFGSGIAFVASVMLFPWSATRVALRLGLRPWHVIPPLIVIPLLLAVMGPSWLTYLLAGSFYAFVATAVFALAALEDVSPNFVFLARIAGAGRLWIAWRVRAISVLPVLVGPIKIVGSFTLGVIVVLEYLAAPAGIGRVMKFAVSYNAVGLILAGLFWAALIGFGFGACLDGLSRRCLRWAPRTMRDASSLNILTAQRLASR